MKKVNCFDYYKYGSRLIRINEVNDHYRDITPDKTTHLSSKYLKERFPGGFTLIKSLDFNLDNDEFMELYNSFKTNIRNMVISNGSRLDEAQHDFIKKHLETGAGYRDIARKVGCNVSTVSRIAKKEIYIDRDPTV